MTTDLLKDHKRLAAELREWMDGCQCLSKAYRWEVGHSFEEEMCGIFEDANRLRMKLADAVNYLEKQLKAQEQSA